MIGKGVKGLVENDTDGKFLRQSGHSDFYSFLSYFMDCEVNNYVVYKSAMEKEKKTGFEGFVSRFKKFGSCPAAMRSCGRISGRRMTLSNSNFGGKSSGNRAKSRVDVKLVAFADVSARHGLNQDRRSLSLRPSNFCTSTTLTSDRSMTTVL